MNIKKEELELGVYVCVCVRDKRTKMHPTHTVLARTDIIPLLFRTHTHNDGGRNAFEANYFLRPNFYAHSYPQDRVGR